MSGDALRISRKGWTDRQVVNVDWDDVFNDNLTQVLRTVMTRVDQL